MKNGILSIILPVYNEARFIDTILERIYNSDAGGMKKEVIIVDDGSTDKTVFNLKSQIAKLKSKGNAKNISFKIITKSKNEGKGSALKIGFLASTGDIVLIQDADLEYNPKDYPLLLEPFINFNADVVYGSRFVSNRPRRIFYFWHYIANMMLTSFSNMLTNLNITDMETGYKVFKGKLIRDIAKHLESRRFGFEPEITARISKIKGINIYEVGISYQGRTYEEGKKIMARDAFKAVWEIIKFNI